MAIVHYNSVVSVPMYILGISVVTERERGRPKGGNSPNRPGLDSETRANPIKSVNT